MKQVSIAGEKQQIDMFKALENVYDYMRFVDPTQNKVISFASGKFSISGEMCFAMWEKGKICPNCISIRAYKDNQTYVKIEFNTKRIFMVTAIPIQLEDRTIVLELMKDATKTMVIENADNESVVEVNAFLEQLNMAILKDSLSEVYNRRFIDERLPIDVENAVKHNKNLTLIMCDLDNFKEINDKYGHLAGDQAIKRFSKVIKYCIRKDGDWVARFGGDEFIVCLTGVEEDANCNVAERIRKTLKEEQLLFSDEKVRITASLGVASLRELETPSAEALLECADKKLYKAKKKGGNKVQQ